jgi:hypothetical protein
MDHVGVVGIHHFDGVCYMALADLVHRRRSFCKLLLRDFLLSNLSVFEADNCSYAKKNRLTKSSGKTTSRAFKYGSTLPVKS